MYELPVFTTERLVLRDLAESDAAAYEKHFVDYEVIKELSHVVPWPYPKGGVLKHIRDVMIPQQGKGHWVWGIFLKDAPEEAIGCVHLRREGNPGNRGFWLGRKYWGMGLMTEAVIPVMDYAFSELGFKIMILSNARGNVRSRRVKEKTGAIFLRIESGQFVNPDYTEREVWELNKEDWQRVRAKTQGC
jgi:RimJ/RimL family protein N-acetyltransferase